MRSTGGRAARKRPQTPSHTYTPYRYIEGMSALAAIGDSPREAFFMFWETLWALVLGFALSGAAQAFVSRGQMQRVLGRRGIASVLKATALGSASSSCSYPPAPMAKPLFANAPAPFPPTP